MGRLRDAVKPYQESLSYEAYSADCDRYGTDPMTKEEEYEAFRNMWDGDEKAREKIFMRNQRYVIREVWKFVGGKMPVEDLLQEANIGLLRAIDKFDTSRNLRFLTYARWFVRSHMQDAVLRTAYVVTLPKRHWVEASRAMRASAEMMEKRRDIDPRRRPSPKEVAEYMGDREAPAVIADIMRYGNLSADTTPCDKQGDGDPLTLIDSDMFSVDGCEDDVLLDVDRQKMRGLVNDALDTLTPAQKDVLENIYGLNGKAAVTSREYAESHGVSRQAIDFRVKVAINNASGAIKRRELKEALESVQIG